MEPSDIYATILLVVGTLATWVSGSVVTSVLVDPLKDNLDRYRAMLPKIGGILFFYVCLCAAIVGIFGGTTTGPGIVSALEGGIAALYIGPFLALAILLPFDH